MATARLLIVDDQPALLHAVAKMLKSRYEVLSASSPLKALEIVNAEPGIDLVISDVEMSEMRGPDLLAEVHRISPSTAGLLMSGSAEFGAEYPADTPFLRKPFSSKELFATVEMVLARSHKLRSELVQKIQRTGSLLEHAQSLKSKLGEEISRSAELRQESCAIRNLANDDPKQNAATAICAFCSAVLSVDVDCCDQCKNPLGPHFIVHDGYSYGIAINGEIKIHGLKLKKAQELASILNSINIDPVK